MAPNGALEALYLVHRIPYPPDKGDKIRSWNLLRHLAKTHQVHLGAFVDDPEDLQHRAFLESVCASVKLVEIDPTRRKLLSLRGFATGEALSMPYYRVADMAEWVRETRRRPLDLEVAFSSTMAPYLEAAPDGRPRLVDLVDADSEKWRAYAAAKSFPMSWVYAREAERLGAAERRIAEWADASFLVTPAERDILVETTGAPAEKVDWWANGVDTDVFDPEADFELLAEPYEFVFTGAMDYWANAEAISWFVAEVWPTIRAEAPQARLGVVGARPGADVQKLADAAGVTVTGRVEDVRPYIAGASVSVAPLRIARGVQNKVLEAMAMARAVLATPEAATGIDAAAGEEIIVASDAATLAREALSLLNDPERRAALGAAARACVQRDYSWEGRLARFDAALAAARARRAASVAP
ncbi:MAG: TIGR03087 family PEP-CTERM/XrtA system glycosyltransferase [Pseudomonadota bacterium]